MSRPVEVLLHHMPTVAAKAQNEWAANFARSVIRQARRSTWRPSPKQIGIMNRLVAELFQKDDASVIEDFK
jgi:hypothetical protein